MQTATTLPMSPTRFTLVIMGEASLDRPGLECMLEALVGQVRQFAQSKWETVIDPTCVASIRSGPAYASQMFLRKNNFMQALCVHRP